MFNNQRATRRQPHLAVKGFVDLLVHMELLKNRQAFVRWIEVLNAVGELGVERLHVGMHIFVQLLIVNDDAAIVRVELFANHAHGKRWLAIQQSRPASFGCLCFDGIPLIKQTRHIGVKFMFGGRLGSRTHNESVLGWLHTIENAAQTLTHIIGQTLRDAVGL